MSVRKIVPKRYNMLIPSFKKHRRLHRYATYSWNLESTHVFILPTRLFFLMHSLKYLFHVQQQLCLSYGGCFLYSLGGLDDFPDWIPGPCLCYRTYVLIQFKIHVAHFSVKLKLTFFYFLIWKKKSLILLLWENQTCHLLYRRYELAMCLGSKRQQCQNWCSDLNTGNIAKISHSELNSKCN